MKILSVETSGKICAVAITENDKIIVEELLEDENTHSVKLMPMLKKLLSKVNMKIQDIDLFACDIGPGSFTGIRIGVSTIKAFLDVTGKKVVGVSSLENLAYNLDTNNMVCTLIDAKNNNVYAGFFKKQNGIYKPVNLLQFASIEEIMQQAKKIQEKITFIGNGSLLHKSMIESILENAEVIIEEELNKLNARNIAKVAFLKKDEAVESQYFKPIYLRKSNAER